MGENLIPPRNNVFDSGHHKRMIINPYRFAGGGDNITTPLHWWDLDDVTAGQGLLDQGTGAWGNLTNNGGLTADSGTAPDGGDCVAGFATGSYLDRSDVAWDGGQDEISISCWVNASAISGAGNWLVSWRKQTTNLVGQSLIWNGSPDYARSDVWDAAADVVTATSSTTTVSTSTFYNIVTTWDGTTIKVYQDTVLVDSATASPTVDAFSTNAVPFALGAGAWDKSSATLSHAGKLWSTGIWDVALTTDEISHLYNSGSGRKYADL